MDPHRQLCRAIAALDTSSGTPVVVRLEAGHVVGVVGRARESNLIEITYDGRSYKVFNADLLERSDAVSIAAGTSGAPSR